MGKGKFADAPKHNFTCEYMKNIRFTNVVSRNVNITVEISAATNTENSSKFQKYVYDYENDRFSKLHNLKF